MMTGGSKTRLVSKAGIVSAVVLVALPGGAVRPTAAAAQAGVNDSGPAFELEPIDRSELRYNGRSFGEWQREFRTDLSAEKRIQALPALLKFGRHGYAAEAAATMAEALDDVHDTELFQAATAHLSRLGRAAVPLLVKRLQSDSLEVRIAVVKSLGDIGPLAEAAVPALLPIAAIALHAEVPWADVALAEAAFEALKRIVTAATPEVRQGLESPSPGLREVCIRLMEQVLPQAPAAERKGPVDTLLRLLGDSQPSIRTAAAVALWQAAADSPRVIDSLVAAVRSDAGTLGYELAHSFYAAEVSESGQAHFSRPALDRHAEEHSEAAVRLLAAVLDSPCFDRLADPNAPYPQGKVFHLLGLFGRRAAEAVPSLTRRLKSPDAWMRCAAADVLGCIGPNAAAAADSLRELAADDAPVPSQAVISLSPEAPVSSTISESGAGRDELPADTVGAHACAALLHIRATAR